MITDGKRMSVGWCPASCSSMTVIGGKGRSEAIAC
jgi:hypothetical protein